MAPPAKTPNVQDVLAHYDACPEAREWAKKYQTLEELWVRCPEPEWMLWSLEQVDYRNDAKLRVFACTCARHWWHLLDDRRSRQAVEVGEKFARGAASLEELAQAWSTAKAAAAEVAQAPSWSVARVAAASVAQAVARASARAAARAASKDGIRAAAWAQARENAPAQEAAWQTDQLRLILGEDYREVIQRSRAGVAQPASTP